MHELYILFLINLKYLEFIYFKIFTKISSGHVIKTLKMNKGGLFISHYLESSCKKHRIKR